MQGYIHTITNPHALRGFSDIDIHLDIDADDRAEINDDDITNFWTTDGSFTNKAPIQNLTLTQTNFLDCSHDWPNEELGNEKYLFLIRATKSIQKNEEIVERLLYLNNATKDDGDCAGITLDSLIVFFRFISTNLNIKKPSITLTSDYNIYLSWKESNDKLINLHLKSFESIDFLIYNNDTAYKNVNRMSGTVSIDMVKEILSQNISNWIFD